MSSHVQISRSHKSKNPRKKDEDSGGVTLTPHNPSKPQFLKTLFALAKQSQNPPSSIDRDELQEPTPQKNPMKLSVQPESKTDNEYENEADDDFRHSSQQPFQPAHHGLEENLFDEDENAFISDYQSDPKPSRLHVSLKKKRIDLEKLKEKNQNLRLWHSMKPARTFSGPEKSSIPRRSRSIKRPKKEEICHSTGYANFFSFYHQIESGSESWTPNEKYKEAKRFLAIEEDSS